MAHLLKSLAGAGERVALAMNQALDLQKQFHIAAPVKPLPGSALVGLELGKLRLPKAQHIRLQLADPRDISNFEIETVGDRGCVRGALVG